MISVFSILTGLVSVIIAFILYLVYIFVVRPYFLLQFYKKQGATAFFCPVAGTNPRDIENILKHGDFYYAAKEWARERPKARAQASTLGTSVLILLKDPELIKNFYLNHDQCYEKHPQFVRLIKMLAGNGVLLADGAIWKRHRKLASIAFSFEFLKEMIPEVVEVADECLESWKKKDLNNIDMLAEIQLITGELVGRLFFGETFSQYEIDGMNITQRLAEIVAEVSMENEFPRTFLLSERLIKMGLLDVHRKIVKKIMNFRAFIKSIAVQRLAEIEKEEKEGSGSTSTTKRKRVNLMELFYKQRKQNAAEAFSDEELVDGFITFFIAGTDTTGHLLTMASYYLMKNPQCKEKVYQDIDKYFSDPSTVSIDSLNKMDNLTALMKETLRISPVGGVMFYRVATQDNDLGGFKIKKGTILNISFLSNYWDSDYYEESEKFKPERWLEEGRTKKSVAENGYVYTPFSAGSRNCIGQHLAMNEARIIFSLFLKKFEYSLVDENYELKMTERSLYEPLDPLIYKIQLK